MDLQFTEELDIVSFISSLHRQDSALIKTSPFCNPGEILEIFSSTETFKKVVNNVKSCFLISQRLVSKYPSW